ncbi:MAG: glycosyltransferase [Candidatus Micrarchaeales archaeon]|jgi:dolichol-phosphate mannosyltransferase
MKIDYGEFTIVLPTLNEGGTIGKLVGYITKNYKEVKVLVVDDGSRDETKQIVRTISKRNRNVIFFDRSAGRAEKGLTASVIDGIARSRTKYAIVMDSDLQHPPVKIREIAGKLSEGNDLVVAYRADVPNWALYRKIISKAFMIFGKLVLLVENRISCRDIMSGFFGVNTNLFTKVYKKNERRFVKDGYKVLFDFLKCMKRRSIHVSEVPYVFGLRKQGKSKASTGRAIALVKSFFS